MQRATLFRSSAIALHILHSNLPGLYFGQLNKKSASHQRERALSIISPEVRSSRQMPEFNPWISFSLAEKIGHLIFFLLTSNIFETKKHPKDIPIAFTMLDSLSIAEGAYSSNSVIHSIYLKILKIMHNFSTLHLTKISAATKAA